MDGSTQFRDQDSCGHCPVFRRETRQTDIWKSIALFLAGVLVSLVTIQVTQIRGTITRSEAEALINNSGPYMADRSMILTKLDSLRANQESQGQKLDDLQNQTTRIAVAVGVADNRGSKR